MKKKKNRALLLLHLLTQILRAASFFVAFANLVSSIFFLNAWLLKASFANICKKETFAVTELSDLLEM